MHGLTDWLVVNGDGGRIQHPHALYLSVLCLGNLHLWGKMIPVFPFRPVSCIVVVVSYI